jgi:hypothetical protein
MVYDQVFASTTLEDKLEDKDLAGQGNGAWQQFANFNRYIVPGDSL